MAQQFSRLLQYLDNSDFGASAGLNQGIQSWGAQIECSNADGSFELSTMKCYARAYAGFSLEPSSPVRLPAALAVPLRSIMSDKGWDVIFRPGYQGLQGALFCHENGGGTPSFSNECRLVGGI